MQKGVHFGARGAQQRSRVEVLVQDSDLYTFLAGASRASFELHTKTFAKFTNLKVLHCHPFPQATSERERREAKSTGNKQIRQQSCIAIRIEAYTLWLALDLASIRCHARTLLAVHLMAHPSTSFNSKHLFTRTKELTSAPFAGNGSCACTVAKEFRSCETSIQLYQFFARETPPLIAST